MSELESEAMEAEFGTVARWTEEAVRALGPGHAIPAGCRGSGSEGGLRWLADRLRLTPGSRVLDDGAGVGGPAGWLAAERGVRAVCAEPMHAAAGAAARLFGLPSVTAVAQQLPFADGAFDAAWCLGVLCTTSDKAAALTELRRVLRDGGRLGLLVFVAQRPLPPPLPEGNEFPTEEELLGLLGGAGLRLEETATADLGDSPGEWSERADAVDAEVAGRHGSDPRWAEAQEQSRRVGRLLSDGALRPWLGVSVAQPRPDLRRNAPDTQQN
jgi:SAM-dependent methyltransferase